MLALFRCFLESLSPIKQGFNPGELGDILLLLGGLLRIVDPPVCALALASSNGVPGVGKDTGCLELGEAQCNILISLLRSEEDLSGAKGRRGRNIRTN